jgi:CheY-like chemotaxis protein
VVVATTRLTKIMLPSYSEIIMLKTKETTTRLTLPMKLKILFVDDDEATVKLFYRAMKKEPLEIKTALDGLQALDRLKTFPADIVITDIQMPRMNGMSLSIRIFSSYSLPEMDLSKMQLRLSKPGLMTTSSSLLTLRSLNR